MIEQLEDLIDRFQESPVLSIGFPPSYLNYNELAKPYLLELDILNFFTGRED
jgi:hypothetical protein